MPESFDTVSLGAIELAIPELRGQRVLLDADLAVMYGVETRALIQATRRNPERFPDDFMFQLCEDEWGALRPVGVGHGGRRTLPYAFTQEGVAMLSSVLRSERAVHVNVQIMRAFVRMREVLMARTDLSRRIDDLEAKYDSQFGIVFDAIRQLMAPPVPKKNPIGFVAPDDPSS
jgi:hypothetical protein